MEESTDRPIILFEHTDICNSGNLVISDLNMSIYPGEFLYIIGKVGSGKTSIIRTIIGEIPVTKGIGSAPFCFWLKNSRPRARCQHIVRSFASFVSLPHDVCHRDKSGKQNEHRHIFDAVPQIEPAK